MNIISWYSDQTSRFYRDSPDFELCVPSPCKTLSGRYDVMVSTIHYEMYPFVRDYIANVVLI